LRNSIPEANDILLFNPVPKSDYGDWVEKQNVNLSRNGWIPKVPTSGSGQVPADRDTLKSILQRRSNEGCKILILQQFGIGLNCFRNTAAISGGYG
jgi:hypothetical protein